MWRARPPPELSASLRVRSFPMRGYLRHTLSSVSLVLEECAYFEGGHHTLVAPSGWSDAEVLAFPLGGLGRARCL